MEEPPNTPARSSALEAQARDVYELLLATTEAMRAFYAQVGAALHEEGDDSPDELRELALELFDMPSRLIALALRLRVIWPEAARSSDSTGVTD